MDGCNADVGAMDWSYPALGAALNATGRPMIYSCSWPGTNDMIVRTNKCRQQQCDKEAGRGGGEGATCLLERPMILER